MRRVKIFLIVALALIRTAAIGQITPGGLRYQYIQKEIINKVGEFDSLVFVDVASFWGDDHLIRGFGFKTGDICRVTIFFRDANSSGEDFHVKRIYKGEKCTDDSLPIKLKDIHYSAIASFSDDSLNIKSRTNLTEVVSDDVDETILLIKGNRYILRQSYAPEFYQGIAPTKERKMFIDVVDKLYKLVKEY